MITEVTTGFLLPLDRFNFRHRPFTGFSQWKTLKRWTCTFLTLRPAPNFNSICLSLTDSWDSEIFRVNSRLDPSCNNVKMLGVVFVQND